MSNVFVKFPFPFVIMVITINIFMWSSEGANYLYPIPSFSCDSVCADCHLSGTFCMWADCSACIEGCAGTAGECTTCLGGAGEAGAPVIVIIGLVALALFTIVGIFYSVLVATMVGQRIWQRHYHILAKRMLTKVKDTLDYFVDFFLFVGSHAYIKI